MSLSAAELDALRARLENYIAASTKELEDEMRDGNEYGMGVAEAAHSTLMYLVENYIDPLWSALGEARATADRRTVLR